jgi:hypothetical protein
MGYAKRLMEAEEEKSNAATAIALQAEVLIRCEYHSEVVMENGAFDIEDAYKLGNAKFSAGEFKRIFSDRRDMTDHIKEAVEEAAYNCSFCEKMMSDD